jgi:hypothetical protein
VTSSLTLVCRYQVDQLGCGVCIASVDEIQAELQKTENSTSTLDLRWGLTAEVPPRGSQRMDGTLR